MKPGIVTFSGAGPGAPDLLTVRAHKAIAEADIIIYAGSLVSPEVLAHARPDCALHDSAPLDLEQITTLMIDAARANKRVLRLHTGDPAIYGATAEQMRILDAANIAYETIPGVSAAFAAAAALNAELTQPGITQTVTITRRAGRTPVPERESLKAQATHGSTLALYLSVSDMPGVVDELLSAGVYTPQTAAAVVYRASWPDEKIVRGTLSDIAEKVAAAGIRRQALILVGDALKGQGDDSLLYDRNFAHGYRDAANGETVPSAPSSDPFLRFAGNIAVYALTEAGCETARTLADQLNATAYTSAKHWRNNKHEIAFDAGKLSQLFQRNWKQFDAHICVMASGIVVRKIAPLLESKQTDPAVVVLDEKRRYAQSLLSGHLGGANRLCQDISRLSGATPVLSTASDVQHLTAFDELAAMQGWRIETPGTIKDLNAALLQKQAIGLVGFKAEEVAPYQSLEYVDRLDIDAFDTDELNAVVTLDSELSGDCTIPHLALKRLPLTVGIGCRRGVPASEIDAAIDVTCTRYGIARSRLTQLASIDVKADEAGILETAKKSGWKTRFFTSEELASQHAPTPSDFVAQTVNTPSVSEAAALASGQGRLLVPKQKIGAVTVAIATIGELCPRAHQPNKTRIQAGTLIAIGLGPGTRAGMTHEAEDAIRSADCVVGYTTYCKQITWLTGDENVYSTGMRSEIERCDEAVKRAAEGKTVALICSGDAGVYGMAGLALERIDVLGMSTDVTLKVIPGVTSSCSAAAAVGAPLMNDFATVSLSDLLTPREIIQQRIDAVVTSGMVCALYNPRSRKRQALLDEVLEKFSISRGADVPCAIVRDAGRPGQWTWTGPLNEIPIEEINMTTMVIIGNEQSRLLNGHLYTRRGYERKDSY